MAITSLIIWHPTCFLVSIDFTKTKFAHAYESQGSLISHQYQFSCNLISPQEAYSVARQFNMIPPVCEQAEYHLFQREKVEVQLPELYHKIGNLHNQIY